MTYRGRVRNGVVELEEPGSLPDGAQVIVELVQPGCLQESLGLIDEWLGDESGYDEQSWPDVKKGLDRERLSSRRLFDG